MNPTEHEMTVAVEAVARHAWNQSIASGLIIAQEQDWEKASPYTRLSIREQALPVVVLALEAIPDRRATLLAELDTIVNDPGHDLTGLVLAIKDLITRCGQ